MRSFRYKAIKCRSSCREVCIIDMNKDGQHMTTLSHCTKTKSEYHRVLCSCTADVIWWSHCSLLAQTLTRLIASSAQLSIMTFEPLFIAFIQDVLSSLLGSFYVGHLYIQSMGMHLPPFYLSSK